MFSFLYQGSHCFGAFGIDGRVVAIHPQYLSIVMPCGIKMRKILKNKIKVRARVCWQVHDSSYGCEVHVLIIELLLSRTVGIIKGSTSSHHGGRKWTRVVHMKPLQEVLSINGLMEKNTPIRWVSHCGFVLSFLASQGKKSINMQHSKWVCVRMAAFPFACWTKQKINYPTFCTPPPPPKKTTWKCSAKKMLEDIDESFAYVCAL